MRNAVWTCSRKPCPRCSGNLAKTNRVYPHSFFQAIRDGDESVLHTILNERNPDLNQLNNSAGDTPLSLAALIGNHKARPGLAAKICKILLRHGARPSARNRSNGRTALIEMVQYRGKFDNDVSDLQQSSVNEQDNFGCTALMFAAEGAGAFAARRGNMSIVRQFLNYGANPLLCDNSGRTALVPP